MGSGLFQSVRRGRWNDGGAATSGARQRLSGLRFARAHRRDPSGFLCKAICCASPCAPFRLLLRRGLSHSTRFSFSVYKKYSTASARIFSRLRTPARKNTWWTLRVYS